MLLVHFHDVRALSVASDLVAFFMQPVVDGVVTGTGSGEVCHTASAAVHVDPLLLGYLCHVLYVLRISLRLHRPRVESKD